MTRRIAILLITLPALLVVGWFARSTERPTPDDQRFTLGIDVSHHQGAIDWRTVEQDGVRFAWIKATEGGDWKDPRFAENWAATRVAGIPRGAYHYFTFCAPGAAQAQNFIDSVPAEASALPPAIDLEFAGNCSKRPSRAELRAELDPFLAALRRHYGVEPVLYVTPISYWRFVAGSGLDVALWRRDVTGTPRWPPGSAYTVWQYADDGVVAGIQGDVDLNVFDGSHGDLRSWAGVP
ncbi:MAG: glycoside hydrolase family 25 protein [Deltaproteobacteria bacterium]|nr:glycoside hydrolase family 25 protein [Deltaproteobacteria bacterium]